MAKNIYIRLVANKLVFDGHFPQKNEIVREWHFQSNCEKSDFRELYFKCIPNEIGWSSYDIEITSKNISFSIIPTFFVESIEHELSKENKDLLNIIIEQIDQYVKKNKIIHNVFINQINEIEKESFAFVFQEPGQSDSLVFQNFLNQLKANNIKFQIEYELSSAHDQGASGGLYKVMVFIQDTVASGVLYDLIKKVPSLIFTGYKKERIDIFKEKAAHYLSTQPENIELIHLEENSGTVNITINFNREKYNLKFNSHNEVIHFNILNQ